MNQEKGKGSKRRKHRSCGKECAAAECNSYEYNSDGRVSGLHGRDGFRVRENTVICEKHFRKHEIIKLDGE